MCVLLCSKQRNKYKITNTKQRSNSVCFSPSTQVLGWKVSLAGDCVCARPVMVVCESNFASTRTPKVPHRLEMGKLYKGDFQTIVGVWFFVSCFNKFPHQCCSKLEMGFCSFCTLPMHRLANHVTYRNDPIITRVQKKTSNKNESIYRSKFLT